MRPRLRVESGGPCHGRTASKEEKEDIDGSDNSGYEQIQLDLYRVFDRYSGRWTGRAPGRARIVVDDLLVHS